MLQKLRTVDVLQAHLSTRLPERFHQRSVVNWFLSSAHNYNIFTSTLSSWSA